MEYEQKLKLLSEYLGIHPKTVLDLGLDYMMDKVLDMEFNKEDQKKILEDVEKDFKNKDK